MNRKFQQSLPISKDEAERALSSSSAEVVSDAIIRVAFWEKDWPWAEARCLSLLKDHRSQVRGAALIAIGHLARLHHCLHLEVVLPAVRELANDQDCGGIVLDVLDDIASFIPSHRRLV